MLVLSSVKTVYLFTPKYPPSRGGASTFYSNMISTTNDRVNYFVVTEHHSNEPTVSRQENASIYRILPQNSLIPSYFRVLLEVILLLIVSAYVIIREDIDIIHTHASSFSVISLAVVSMVFRVPLAYDCQDEAFRPWIVRMGYRPVWFSCASNIDEILMRNSVPEDRIIRLPVVSPEYVRKYREISEPEKISNILYIGSVREAKGIFCLLEAFEIIRERGFDLRLTIIGDGPDRDELEERCVEAGLSKYVTFTGSLSHTETMRRLAESDILVLPSKSEGLSRVVLEAQDVGTPVVATAVGGIPDAISHEENGMLAAQTNESVAENVIRLIHDDILYQTLVENGIKSADERSWALVETRLFTGYEKILA